MGGPRHAFTITVLIFSSACLNPCVSTAVFDYLLIKSHVFPYMLGDFKWMLTLHGPHF